MVTNLFVSNIESHSFSATFLPQKYPLSVGKSLALLFHRNQTGEEILITEPDTKLISIHHLYSETMAKVFEFLNKQKKKNKPST